MSLSSITINLSLNFQTFNSDSLVMLIFKHLVNSKGLNNLLRMERYESERFVWRRINKQLETLMLEIFHRGKEQEKHLQEIRRMMDGIYPCKRELLADVQMLLASTLLSKLRATDQVDMGLFAKLKASMVEEEFDIIHGELEELLERPIELMEMEELPIK